MTLHNWPPRKMPKSKNSQKKSFAEKKLKTGKSPTKNDAGLQAPPRLGGKCSGSAQISPAASAPAVRKSVRRQVLRQSANLSGGERSGGVQISPENFCRPKLFCNKLEGKLTLFLETGLRAKMFRLHFRFRKIFFGDENRPSGKYFSEANTFRPANIFRRRKRPVRQIFFGDLRRLLGGRRGFSARPLPGRLPEDRVEEKENSVGEGN